MKRVLIYLVIFLISLNVSYAAFIEWSDVSDGFHDVFNYTGDSQLDFLILVLFVAMWFIFNKSLGLVMKNMSTGAVMGLSLLFALGALVAMPIDFIEEYQSILFVIGIGMIVLFVASRLIRDRRERSIWFIFDIIFALAGIGLIAMLYSDMVLGTDYYDTLLNMTSGNVGFVIVLLVGAYWLLRFFRFVGRNANAGGGYSWSRGRPGVAPPPVRPVTPGGPGRAPPAVTSRGTSIGSRIRGLRGYIRNATRQQIWGYAMARNPRPNSFGPDQDRIRRIQARLRRRP